MNRPPVACLDCGVDISDLFAQDDTIEWCEDCAGWSPYSDPWRQDD